MQSCCEVWGLADNVPFLCLASTDKAAYDNQTGANTYPDSEPFGCLELANSLDESQTRSYRPLGVVLVASREAKIDQHTIAQVPSDETIVPADRLGDTFLIHTNQFPQVLRIEPRS